MSHRDRALSPPEACSALLDRWMNRTCASVSRLRGRARSTPESYECDWPNIPPHRATAKIARGSCPSGGADRRSCCATGLATPEMPQGFASRSAAPDTARRRRTGHSTWARPTGFAVDSPLEGRDSNPRSPGLGEVVADELTDSGRPPDEAPRIMASAGVARGLRAQNGPNYRF